MDFAKLGRSLLEKSSEAISTHQQLLLALAKGEIVIPEDVLKIGIRRAASKNPELSDIDVECREGIIRIGMNVRTLKLLEHRIVLDFKVEAFRLTATEQCAQLHFTEGATPEAMNWSSSVASWFANVSIDNLMSDPKRVADLELKSGGIASFEWPIARIHLDRHDAIILLNRLEVFSRFAIVECRVEPGRVVFPVAKAKLNS